MQQFPAVSMYFTMELQRIVLVRDVNLTNGLIFVDVITLVARTTVYHTLCSYIHIDSAVKLLVI